MKELMLNFPHLLTVGEVSQIFRLTRTAVRRLIRSKELPAVRIGKEYRIPSHVVENILNPITEANLEYAAYGLWKNARLAEGSVWVKKHRRTDKRSLPQLIEDVQKE